MKWKKRPVPAIDRHLASNGAHAAPAVYDLVAKTGDVAATVKADGAVWRYWINGEASGAFPSADAAKGAARHLVDPVR